MRSEDPTIRFADSVMVIANWHNAQIIDLGGRMTVPHVRAIKMNFQLLVSRFPRLVTGITAVRHTVPMSDKAIHDELTKMLKEQKEAGIEMKGSTVAYETRGVIGTAIRAVARTVMTISGNRQNQIVSSVDEGVPLMLPHVRTVEGEAVTRSALEEAIRKVRAAYEKHLAAEAVERT
jgi:hypothetical protein